jgi:tetratricopeptide (TPR) repeat protein
MWQRVSVTDHWYESTRTSHAAGAAALGRDSLARAVETAGDELLQRFPDHPRGADIVWRQSQLALAHGWYERAAQCLAHLEQRYPDDARAPVAAGQRGDALFELGRFDQAGAAFEAALASARRLGRDSLAARAAKAIPVCYYRYAEAEVAADSTRYARHAQLFEQVATRWPEYEHAPLAQYRAALAYDHAGQPRESIRAMQALLARFPASEFARDARLHIAKTWETQGEREPAAAAYLEFAERDSGDDGAGAAILKAADLYAAAGLEPRAEELRLSYIRKYPGDVETAMQILEALARRDLAGLGAGRPVSALLASAGGARGRAAAPSHLATYLKLAGAHPALASRAVLAQLRFLQGEETFASYSAARLTQPLAKSIPVKQRLLDTLLVRYRRSVDLGVPEWAHAAAFRIGQALIGFAEALEGSERPSDLSGDDLRAYAEVLAEQGRPFRDRGENVWTELLQKSGPAASDAWVTQARDSLWRQISARFAYRPEVEYPLLEDASPPKEHAEKGEPERKQSAARASGGRASAQMEADRR